MLNQDNKINSNVLINIFYGIGFTAISFIILLGFSTLDKLAENVKQLDERIDDIPIHYIQKVDYVTANQQLISELKRLSEKLDERSRNIESDYNRRMDKLERTLEEYIRLKLKNE